MCGIRPTCLWRVFLMWIRRRPRLNLIYSALLLPFKSKLFAAGNKIKRQLGSKLSRAGSEAGRRSVLLASQTAPLQMADRWKGLASTWADVSIMAAPAVTWQETETVPGRLSLHWFFTLLLVSFSFYFFVVFSLLYVWDWQACRFWRFFTDP